MCKMCIGVGLDLISRVSQTKNSTNEMNMFIFYSKINSIIMEYVYEYVCD